MAESNGELSLTHLIHTTTDTLHESLSANEHLFQTSLFLLRSMKCSQHVQGLKERKGMIEPLP